MCPLGLDTDDRAQHSASEQIIGRRIIRDDLCRIAGWLVCLLRAVQTRAFEKCWRPDSDDPIFSLSAAELCVCGSMCHMRLMGARKTSPIFSWLNEQVTTTNSRMAILSLFFNGCWQASILSTSIHSL